ELIPHSRAEEALFYNALREIDETKDLVAHSYEEHLKAETELRALSAAKKLDASWTAMIEKFCKDVKHHVEEEEGKVFAAAKKALSDSEANQIGEAFKKLKTEMARDADSITASTVDLLANLLPGRFAEGFRKKLNKRSAA